MDAIVFEKEFEKWLLESLQSDIPPEIKAFSFNLFEPFGEEEIEFGIELIGANTFDENNPDWACNKIWEPINRQLSIPTSYSSSDFEICLDKMKALIKIVLKSNKHISDKLQQCEATAIGFVDGDLHLIYLRANQLSQV
jgi:hypothetical protein